MLKVLVFFFIGVLFLSCRKDANHQIDDFESACGDFSKPYCLHPIPANDSISISLYVSVNDHVLLTYFDRWGNNVDQKLDSNLLAGQHTFKFDVFNLPIGVNVCKIEFSNQTYLAKIIKVQ
ncbi:MAG: hypothetical protein AB8B72_07305 [Crocinitomicaceae bacterium]